MLTNFKTYPEIEDSDDLELDPEDEDDLKIGARPMRNAKVKTKIKPIPTGSSFFIFKSTNKLVVLCVLLLM